MDTKILISTINEIIKYGVNPNLKMENEELKLEKNLVKIYDLFFEINYEFDDTDYGEFETTQLTDIRSNIESNFKNFGLYKTLVDIQNINDISTCAIGDAIDNLSDITIDLSEIKWRLENNSINDGLWFFELCFRSHMQQHILSLLNYMKNLNG